LGIFGHQRIQRDKESVKNQPLLLSNLRGRIPLDVNVSKARSHIFHKYDFVPLFSVKPVSDSLFYISKSQGNLCSVSGNPSIPTNYHYV
jgi:hypothetical protein